MKVMCKGSLCSQHFSWSWRAVKIISAVPLDRRKPYCDSVRISSEFGSRRSARTRASTLPVVDRSEIPLQFPQSALSPFFNMVRIRASLSSQGSSWTSGKGCDWWGLIGLQCYGWGVPGSALSIACWCPSVLWAQWVQAVMAWAADSLSATEKASSVSRVCQTLDFQCLLRTK